MILTTDYNDENKLIIVRKSGVSFIRLESIIFMETSQRCTRIITNTEDYYTHQSLKDIGRELPDEFFRAHKSYIVNMHQIKDIELFANCTFSVEFYGSSEKAYMTKKRLEEMLTKWRD
ncbi:LytTR family transcriptional regulator [Halobacillus litoralis]|nr:LytTR family transcriptional regulator [Halobacillus litoralis]